MKSLLAMWLLAWLGITFPVLAATDVVHVYFLSLEEAASAARSQLSQNGKVAAIASQRMLIIDDDLSHINKAKALLQRIDRVPDQYTAYVSIEDISQVSNRSIQASGRTTVGDPLTGGWLRLKLQHQQHRSRHRQSFQLRISSHQPGSMATGVIQSFSQATRIWLSGYGIIAANSVELIPITSGFHITVSPVANDQVRVRIVPWMQRQQARMQGQQEMFIDLGTSNTPTTAPSNNANMRFNAQPVVQDQGVIEITGAATELIIPIDESITIAAASREAEKLGGALLAQFSSIGKRQFLIHLRITKGDNTN